MKNKKKLIIIVLILILVLGIVFLVFSGGARTDVYLKDFNVSDDGKIMKLNVGVLGSNGYVRKIKRTSGSSNGYYTFYSTYGINSKIGSSDTFEIELNGDTDEIYFYTGDKGYKLVLIKDHISNEWIKINYADTENIKINLINKNDINKVSINTGAQDNNYFEYDDMDTITKIYNIFVGLETTVPSTTFNPDVYKDIYSVSFDTDEYQDKFEWSIELYEKDEKYYLEQRYNGIYEITEEDFDLIKSYIKVDYEKQR